MIFRLLTLCCLAGLFGCTPAFIQARQPPDDVMIKARTRLAEHGIRVDPTGRQSQRLKSIIYCFKDADRQGFQWSRAFGVPAPAPVGFSYVGNESEHQLKRNTCNRIFRVVVEAHKQASGSRIIVSSEWWKLHIGRCTPQGNPLLGKMSCAYTYRGTRAPRDVRGHLYGMLKGL